MEIDPPGFDKPKEPPGLERPQMEAETLNPDSSKETPVKAKPNQTPVKASAILKSSGSRQEDKNRNGHRLRPEVQRLEVKSHSKQRPHLKGTGTS